MNDAGQEKALDDVAFTRDAIACLPDLTRFARALAKNGTDAEDLVQETYLRAYRFWGSFVPGSDCRRWLFTICRNVFLRQTARDRIVESVGDDTEVETVAAVRLHVVARDAGLNDMFVRLDLGPAIAQAIEGLPDVFRTIVQLVDVEGMTYQEVAEGLDVPVGTVRSRLFRGRRLLQQELIEYARDANFESVRDVPVGISAPRAMQGERR
jgi:RNA polymerase sigma-70 factor (ECF subfamily)